MNKYILCGPWLFLKLTTSMVSMWMWMYAPRLLIFSIYLWGVGSVVQCMTKEPPTLATYTADRFTQTKLVGIKVTILYWSILRWRVSKVSYIAEKTEMYLQFAELGNHRRFYVRTSQSRRYRCQGISRVDSDMNQLSHANVNVQEWIVSRRMPSPLSSEGSLLENNGVAALVPRIFLAVSSHPLREVNLASRRNIGLSLSARCRYCAGGAQLLPWEPSDGCSWACLWLLPELIYSALRPWALMESYWVIHWRTALCFPLDWWTVLKPTPLNFLPSCFRGERSWWENPGKRNNTGLMKHKLTAHELYLEEAAERR